MSQHDRESFLGDRRVGVLSVADPREGDRAPLSVPIWYGPAELHGLALEAVAAGLAERGLPFRMCGPALPPEALLEAVRRTGPPAVLLWSQVAGTADRALAVRVARAAWGPPGARTRPVVLAAGPGWSGSRRPPGALRPLDLATALDQLADLLR
ncbi:hypothetical protein ACIRYZ_24875 [Kitasatospora sp. NPDC101155]|uniref:hypothetical protein n=1 Tax=Kitasatospora sp. NPDC101155 TaxID=3364097 RepID=UPI0037F47AD9